MDYPPKKAYVVGMVQGIPSFVASFSMFFFLTVGLAAPGYSCTVLLLCGIASIGS